jgi:hypothetical protein
MTEKVPNLQLRMLGDARETTLFDLAAGRTIVAGNCVQDLFHLETNFFTIFLDFWTTRCERCPAALTKINSFAADYGSSDEVN